MIELLCVTAALQYLVAFLPSVPRTVGVKVLQTAAQYCPTQRREGGRGEGKFSFVSQWGTKTTCPPVELSISCARFFRSHPPPPPRLPQFHCRALVTTGVVSLQPALVPRVLHVPYAAAAATVHPAALLPQSELQNQPRDAGESSPGGTVVIFDWVETLRDLLSRTDYSSSPPPAATDIETRNIPPFPTTEKEEEDDEERLETESSAEDLVEIVHGQAFTDRKSTFQAHLSRVSSEKQVRYQAIRLGYSWKIRWVTSHHRR